MIAATPDRIAHVRICSLRGMLRLEKAGMKSRGGALRPKIAAELGLKPRDSYDTFIKACTEKIEANLKAFAAAHTEGEAA